MGASGEEVVAREGREESLLKGSGQVKK